MFSIKEALLAKERSGDEVDAAIFYMDMRTFGKGFQRYRDRAEAEHGVRFVRSRVHSVEFETESNSLRLHYIDAAGAPSDEIFDIAVLATGQRAPEGTAALAETLGIELNPMGFCGVKDFSLSRTTKEGVFVGGSFSGLRDISESVIQASSASLAASALIHSKGGGLAEVEADASPYRDVSRELPQTAVVLCKCANTQEESSILDEVAKELKDYGWTEQISQIDRMCTQNGWNKLVEQLKGSRANRLLIGACQPCVYGNKLGLLAKSIGLSPHLMDMVDIRTPAFSMKSSGRTEINRVVLGALAMGIAGLRNIDPNVSNPVGVIQKALVVGGGIAGMTAALAIADHGFEVILVEQAEELGGNLRNIHYTIDGLRPKELLESTITRLERSPNIKVYKKSRVVHSQGWVGSFLTSIEKSDGSGVALEHGVTILATGGEGATTHSYAYGQSDAIVTQHELEERLHSGSLKPADLRSVVMIQCVDSREAGRRYCSRICCASALKNALLLKDANPELDIYIFYRDIMAYGLLESYYTRARRSGVLFIQYAPDGKPEVRVENGQISVTGRDFILGRDLVLKPDLLALSTGIVPTSQAGLAEAFGVEVDSDGFFHEAESKWRPVDFIKAGVFMCGIAHSPKSIQESIASAEAAAQRALGIIGNQQLASGKNVAEVRESFCSLCERCIDACPYGARWLDEEEEKIVVNVLTCQGCGSCAAVCPNSASVLRGFSDRRMLTVIDEALGAF
jgi:heterodisulfide reductase subunit A